MKTKNKKKHAQYVKKIWLAFAAFIGFCLLLFFFLSMGWLGYMPSFEELENPKSNLATEIISSDQQLLGTYYLENRTNTSYSELSPHLIEALIATEDVRFFKHSGIDPISIARVITKTILGGDKSSGGGSTITQQLAKNLFPRKRSNKISVAFRKLKEWVIAVKLEHNYTKEEIIAMYFNTVDFGNNSFGIKTASNTYFRKSPMDLSIEEAAVLVGMLKATTYYSPLRNPKNSLGRRNVVLSQMQKANYIDPKQYDSLSQIPLDMSRFTIQDHQYGSATYFREYLRQWLLNWCKKNKKSNGTEYDIYKDGLKIYTTIDSRMQRYAEEAVQEYIGKELQPSFFKSFSNRSDAPFVDVSAEEIQGFLKQAMKNSSRYKSMKEDGYSEKEIEASFRKPIKMKIFSWEGEKDTVMSPWDSLYYHKWFLHCGMMSIEPQTGFVKAYIGGINYPYFQYDNVMQGKRQVGSTFKPFVYTLAMQEGDFAPCTQVPNIPVCIETPGQEPWCPKNSSKAKEGEMVSLRWALANSINYISAYLIKQFPPQAVVDLVKRMGVKSPMDAVPSICLGSCDLSVKEMTAAMATYANKGIYNEPIFVTRVEDKNGLVLEEFTSSQNEAMSEETAYLMIELMKGVVDEGTAGRVRYKYGLTQMIAGKTGTTQNNSDGWFMGLTPRLVTGVWVGGDLRSIHFRSTALGQGANTALPVWAIYMKKIFDDPKIGLGQEIFEAPSQPLRVDLNCRNQAKESDIESTINEM